MRIPLLDLKAQHATLRDEVYAAIEGVVESQWFIHGPEVQALEAEIAKLCEVAHGVGVSSGTDALLAALMALDVGPGDEVVTPAYSFFATAGVVARLGATPVFVDIDPVTYNMDMDQALTRVGPRTRAIIPVHLFGRMAELDSLIAESSRQGIAVIEDAAQAIGATDPEGRLAGSLADAGCFSFFPSKNLGGHGDGGMIVTDDADLAERIRMLRDHGSKPKYYHHLVGGNFRLDALQAAVLRVKLPHLRGWTEARRANADRYRNLFSSSAVADRVGLPEDVSGHIYNQFVIRVPRRDRLREFLQDAGVATEVYYPVPLPAQPCFSELGYRRGDYPHAEAAADETLALPVYPELDDAQAEYVVEQVERFFR
jgi:dTDP-4-amino-4,6-dideoxygalactose transaminase